MLIDQALQQAAGSTVHGPRLISSTVSHTPGGNPYPTLWTAAVTVAGVEVLPFSARRAVYGQFDAVHVHWPDDLFGRVGRSPSRALRVAINLGSVVLSRWRGARLCWTVHNFAPHSGSRGLSRLGLWAFEKLVDEFWVMSVSAGAEMSRRRRGRVVRVMRHPVYPASPRADIVPEENVAITFGEVRPYRGYVELAEEFGAGAGTWSLVIVGRGRRDAYAARLAEACADRDDVRWLDERPSDEHLAELIQTSSVVVLRYEEVTNSGAALLALTLGRPVVVPDLPVFRELRDEVGAEWVHLLTDDLTATLAAAARLKAAPPDLGARSWDGLGKAVRTALDSPGGRHRRARITSSGRRPTQPR